MYNKNSFMITWVVVHIVYKILGGIGWAGAYFSFKSEDEVEQPTNDSAKRIRSSQLNNSVGVSFFSNFKTGVSHNIFRLITLALTISIPQDHETSIILFES